MRSLLSIFLILSFFISSFAQVGINTSTPDDKSVLDLNSGNTKGLLIPRMTTINREIMSTKGFARGMMVYDTNVNIVFVGYGAGATLNKEWYALNPWKTVYKVNSNTFPGKVTTANMSFMQGNVGIGTTSPTEKLEVAGNVKVSGQFIGNGSVPRGGIIMWSGKTPPAGWALCNGGTVNGYKTPNLKGRFVVGYDNGVADYNNPGNLSTKGTTNSDLGGSTSSSHTHRTNPPDTWSEYGGSHTHSGTTNSGGGSISMTRTCCGRYNVATTNHKHSFTTNSRGNHRHLVKLPTTVSEAPTGYDNRPPYYTLAYIMRVY